MPFVGCISAKKKVFALQYSAPLFSILFVKYTLLLEDVTAAKKDRKKKHENIL